MEVKVPPIGESINEGARPVITFERILVIVIAVLVVAAGFALGSQSGRLGAVALHLLMLAMFVVYE